MRTAPGSSRLGHANVFLAAERWTTVLAVAASSALTGLVSLALVIAASPLTVIPAVLVLHAPRPRPAGLAFLAGWLVSIAALTAVFIEVSGLLGGLTRQPPAWASWLRIVVGAGLVGFGVFRWLTRQRHPDMPGWMRSFTSLTPVRAGVTGAALAVLRPEVLLICTAAGLAIGSAELDIVGAWVMAVVFVTVAASSVAIPVLGYAAAGDRLDASLVRFKDWVQRQHAALVAIVLVLLGLMVLYNGVAAL